MANLPRLIVNKFASVLGYERKRSDPNVTAGINFVPLSEVINSALPWTKACDGQYAGATGDICTLPRKPNEIALIIFYEGAYVAHVIPAQITAGTFDVRVGLPNGSNESFLIRITGSNVVQLREHANRTSTTYIKQIWWR